MKTCELIVGEQYGSYIYVQKLQSVKTSSYILVRCVHCGTEKQTRKYDFVKSTKRCTFCGFPNLYDTQRVSPSITLSPQDEKRLAVSAKSHGGKYVYSSSKSAKNAFKKLGPRPVCSNCGIDSWLGEEIVMDIDHIIPVHKGGENSLDNLQWLCPNCHRQKNMRERFGNGVE